MNRDQKVIDEYKAREVQREQERKALEKKSSSKKYTRWIIVLVVIILLGGGIYLLKTQAIDGPYDTFGQCLVDSGILMYGADRCPHCKEQKAMFDGSFPQALYVECTQEVKRCNDAGITSYPIWILKDGTKVNGVQDLEKLGSLTSCEVKVDQESTGGLET